MVFVKGRTSKETHVALAFQRGHHKAKYKWGQISEGKWGNIPQRPYFTDVVLTACGFMLETAGNKRTETKPSCSYCRGYFDNMQAINNGGWLTPEEYFAK